MGPKSVLISNAGIGGSVLVYWLDRVGASVTITARRRRVVISGLLESEPEC